MHRLHLGGPITSWFYLRKGWSLVLSGLFWSTIESPAHRWPHKLLFLAKKRLIFEAIWAFLIYYASITPRWPNQPLILAMERLIFDACWIFFPLDPIAWPKTVPYLLKTVYIFFCSLTLVLTPAITTPSLLQLAMTGKEPGSFHASCSAISCLSEPRDSVGYDERQFRESSSQLPHLVAFRNADMGIFVILSTTCSLWAHSVWWWEVVESYPHWLSRLISLLRNIEISLLHPLIHWIYTHIDL